MKVGIKKVVDVDIKKVNVHIKVRDEGVYTFYDQDDVEQLYLEGEYVPGIFPAGGGDYLELDIDLETGQILNWNEAKVRNYLPDLFNRNRD